MKQTKIMNYIHKILLIVFVALLSSSFALANPIATAATWQEDEKQEDKKDSKEESKQEKADDSKEGESKKDKKEDEEKPRRRRNRRRGPSSFSKGAKDLGKTFSPIVASSSESVVKIMDGKKQIAFGTVVGDDGLVLTKASELRGTIRCVLSDERELEATVIGIDEDTDLALLKIEASELPTISWNEEPTPEVGGWVVNANQTDVPFSIGIVSHNQRKIANSRAMIGIQLDTRDTELEGVRVTVITKDSPADEGGMLINDVIKAVAGDPTPDYDALRKKLGEFEPGDDVTITVERSGEELDLDLTLTSEQKISPRMARGNSQDNMGSTLSSRRRNFTLALQHDSKLNADQCGGPIVDISGRAIGINIARSGRVSSLALPNEVVLESLEMLKSGELAPKVMNKVKIAKVETELKDVIEALGDLPERKAEADVTRSAALAQQKELERIILEANKRLARIQKENKPSIDKAKKLARELEKKQKRQKKLEADLKLLSTGVRDE